MMVFCLWRFLSLNMIVFSLGNQIHLSHGSNERGLKCFDHKISSHSKGGLNNDPIGGCQLLKCRTVVMPCTAAMQKCKGRHSSEFVKRACSALKPLATFTVGKWRQTAILQRFSTFECSVTEFLGFLMHWISVDKNYIDPKFKIDSVHFYRKETR